MTYPVFASGDVLNASDMNAVGLWLVKSQAVGSGVSSVTVTGAFSANYENYRIVYTGGVSSVEQAIQMRLGSSTASYYGALTVVNYATGALSTGGVNNQAQWTYAGGGSTTANGVIIDLAQPFASVRTTISGFYLYPSGAAAGNFVGYHNVASSYTDFTLFVTGTITGGTIRVYGYRN